MFLKGAFKDTSVWVQLLMLAVMLFAGWVIFYTAYFLLLFSKAGMSPEVIQNILLHLYDYPELMRNILFFQSVCLFIFPAIACAWLFSDNYKRYLQIDTPIHLPVAGLVVLSMLVVVPFINCVYAVNQQMVFPEWLKGIEEWMKTMEEMNGKILEKVLYVHDGWDLVYNMVIVCLLAALGEEFMFRGLLQNVFARTLKNPHVIIWIVAFLFSAIHFQFYGFLPRLLLGAYFGYLIYYTHNIWIPVLAHFTNNAVGVITAALFQDAPDTADRIDALGYGSTWWLAVASIALFTLLFWQIKKSSAASTS
jgi:membrane protease YdiL (CAAX protease family)